MRTADRLVECAMMDIMPEVPTRSDFGIKDAQVFDAYQREIRAGRITADQLFQALFDECPGETLSAMIGMPVTSVYDL